MKNIFKKAAKQYFLLIILLVVTISYGQMLKMYVYQDDNAIFVKLANMGERAGYIQPGPFGFGPYKYTVTPYIPIYYLFGYNAVAYYALAFLLYFLSAVCVYWTFSKIVSLKAGKVIGFLYSAGYLASDGFIRLYNSVSTSLSVILLSLMFLCYFNYFKSNKLKWYLLVILLFASTIEFSRARSHYLIAIIILFEVIFFMFQKHWKKILYSFVRLIPFSLIFFYYFLLNPDSRSGQVKLFLLSFLKGDFSQFFGFLTTLTNIILPDWLTSYLFKFDDQVRKLISFSHYPLVDFSTLLLAVSSYLLLKDNKKKWLIPLFLITIFGWRLSAGKIFKTPLLELSVQSLSLATLGGFFIIAIILIFLSIKEVEKKKIFLFLSGWALINIGAYSAYMPLVTYESIHRYLAHSFFALVGTLGLLTIAIQGKVAKTIVLAIILLWGAGNTFSAFALQNNLIRDRSDPARSFYQQFRSYVPKINKGDLLYFDVAENATQHFSDAITVSQMPDTASLSWKYGVDRYAFKRFLDFDEFISVLKTNGYQLNNVHTFFYTGTTLTDTTNEFLKRVDNKISYSNVEWITPEDMKATTEKLSNGVYIHQGDLIINFARSLSGITPVNLKIELMALPFNINQLSCPCFTKPAVQISPLSNGLNIPVVFAYQKFKQNFWQNVKPTAVNKWQNRVAQNLTDGDISTMWQADRLLWKETNGVVIEDLGKVETISKLVWINGFANNTPTKYSVLISSDGSTWETVKNVQNNQKIQADTLQVIEFKPSDARYVQMVIKETLSQDAPAISEMWVIPANLNNLNIALAEKFIRQPLEYVKDASTYEEILRNLSYLGQVKIYWKSNKYDSWKSTEKSEISVIYDGQLHQYDFKIPAGGTEISAIKLEPITIPGDLSINKISAMYSY